MVEQYEIRDISNQKLGIRIEGYQREFNRLRCSVLKVEIADHSYVFIGETYYKALKKLVDFLEKKGMVLEWEKLSGKQEEKYSQG